MLFVMWKRKTPMWVLTGGGIVAVLFLLLTTCGTTYLLVSVYHRRQVDRKEALELQNIMQSLSHLQAKSDRYRLIHEKITESTIQRVFPWLPKSNTLPNYFLYHHQAGVHTGLIKSPASYHQSNIVFMVNPDEAATPFLGCLQDIATDFSLSMSPVMSSRNRIAWETVEGGERVLRERIKIHRGSYTFGMCENLNSSCSYFLMLQDPLEQAVSTYRYCKEAIRDELCSAVNANKVSVQEWIEHQGSLLFRQLLFKPEFCNIDVNSSSPGGHYLINKQNLPCWYKQKLYLDSLPEADIGEAINYVANHLDKWFSVLGHIKDYSSSVKMFEQVYRLPFSKCHNSTQLIQEEPTNDNRAYKSDRRKHSSQDEDIFFLRQNVLVKKALQADYTIYNKAKKLFKIQRQVLFNQIGK